MTRQDAQRLVQNFARSQGLNASLNARGLAGLASRDGELYFEFDEKEQALVCSALVYRFHGAPKPAVLDAFQAEAASGADTGGGTVEFEPQSKGVFLSKRYPIIPQAELLERDLRRLLEASQVWSDEVLPRVAQRVFHPEDVQKRSGG